MTRSAPAPSAPLQTGRAYAGRAGSIMRFSGDDTAQAQPQCHIQKQQAAQGVSGLRGGEHKHGWELLGVRRVEGEKGRGGWRGAKGPRGTYEKRFCASLGSPRLFT